MDTCFNVPELIFGIVSHCRIPELAVLARTARLFDCALDLMWRDLSNDGIICLFKCLSSEAVVVEGSSQRCLSLRNPIEARHWERLKFYTQRVQTLHLRMSLLHPTLLEAIHLWAPLGGVLPNLRRLILWGLFNEPLFLCLFPGSKLELLHLDIGDIISDRKELMLSAISTLPTLCPGLKILYLSLPNNSIYAEPLLKQPFNVRSLVLKSISPAHLTTIPSFSNLTNLSLKFREDGVLPIPSTTPICASLERLHIQGSAKQILRVLDFIGECPIEYLSLLCSSETAAEISAIARAAANRCARDSPREVILNIYQLANAIDFPAANTTRSYDCISPFFTFPNIEKFTSSLFPWLNPNGSFVATLAQSWPNLAYLDVCCHSQLPPIQHVPNLTIRCLVLLAAYCPRLSYLSIEFNATSVDKLDADEHLSPAKDGLRGTNSSLYSLNVGHSPIEATPPIAAFLCQVFPQLKRISSLGSLSGDNSILAEKWAQVEEMVSIKARGLGRGSAE